MMGARPEDEEVEDGSLASLGDSANIDKKQARRAYMSSSGRQLSESARKRQSVMALGTIQHLQHHFARQGLAAATAPQIGQAGKPLPLAIPGGRSASPTSIADYLPPSPSPPPQIADKSFQIEIPSLKAQKEQVSQVVADVCEVWQMVATNRLAKGQTRLEASFGDGMGEKVTDERRHRAASPLPQSGQEHSLILTLLQTTTAAVRTVQRYFLSLPPNKLPDGTDSLAPTQHNARYRRHLGPVTAARPIPRYTSVTNSDREVTIAASCSPVQLTTGSKMTDPLVMLRHASLAALGALKDMESKYRISESELHQDTSNALEAMAAMSLSGSAPPSMTFTDDGSSENSSTNDCLGGHLYREDVTLRDLQEESQVVQRWVETVDTLLQMKAARATRLRTRSSNSDASVSKIPRWARNVEYTDDLLGKIQEYHRVVEQTADIGMAPGRAYACLRAHLPPKYVSYLPEYTASGDSDELFLALSDGQLLCVAYNAALRQSQRPWGFIPEEGIHDVISLIQKQVEEDNQAELDAGPDRLQVSSISMRRPSSGGLSDDGKIMLGGGSRVGLTFRRMENLRVFLSALKLRYLVTENFDRYPTSIARKDDGWQNMLFQMLRAWVSAVAEETRNEDIDSD